VYKRHILGYQKGQDKKATPEVLTIAAPVTNVAENVGVENNKMQLLS
jgi:hypothetical protein